MGLIWAIYSRTLCSGLGTFLYPWSLILSGPLPISGQHFHALRSEKGGGSRGKEMSLSRSIGSYYKLPKSDPNAVYLLPTAIYLLQCCFISANIVWAGQCDNSLFPWKLYKINLTAQQTINTAIKISVNVNWCYSTPRLLLPNFSWQLIF